VILLGLEISLTTPPFGLLFFIVMEVAPEGPKLDYVALSVESYIGCAILLLSLLINWSQIGLCLPCLIEA